MAHRIRQGHQHDWETEGQDLSKALLLRAGGCRWVVGDINGGLTTRRLDLGSSGGRAAIGAAWLSAS